MPTANPQLAQASTLRDFIRLLTSEPARPLDADPPWFENGVTCEVTEATYFEFLEMLPPRWMRGSMFAFGEGCGPFRLFWQRAGKHFGRELTTDETERFCQLSGAVLHQ